MREDKFTRDRSSYIPKSQFWASRKRPGMLFIGALIIAIVFSSSQCTPINHETKEANQTPCPPLGQEAPQKLQLSPTLYLILIKGSPYNIDNQYIPQVYTEESLEIIENTLPDVVMPGDRVMILLMEARDIQDALVSNQAVKNIDSPEISPSPTPHPTLTPSPTPPPITPGSFTEALTQQAVPTSEMIINAAETQRAYLDECAKTQWEELNYENLKTWREQVEDETEKFLEKAEHDLDENIDIDELEYGTQVYEALENSSILFANECSNYARCVLVVFSDMEEFRSATPAEVSIELRDITVWVIFPHCEFIYLGACQK